MHRPVRLLPRARRGGPHGRLQRPRRRGRLLPGRRRGAAPRRGVPPQPDRADLLADLRPAGPLRPPVDPRTAAPRLHAPGRARPRRRQPPDRQGAAGRPRRRGLRSTRRSRTAGAPVCPRLPGTVTVNPTPESAARLSCRLTVQEQHLPGESLEEKFDWAQQAGFDGIELRGEGDLGLAARLPELRRAARRRGHADRLPGDGHFIGNFDAQLRADAIANMKSQLSVMAEIGGRGVMSPASWGMFSLRLPPFVPPRSAAEDRRVLLEALHELGENAEREGIEFYLEPLNRYEDHMVNRLAEAVDLCAASRRQGVRGLRRAGGGVPGRRPPRRCALPPLLRGRGSAVQLSAASAGRRPSPSTCWRIWGCASRRIGRRERPAFSLRPRRERSPST